MIVDKYDSPIVASMLVSYQNKVTYIVIDDPILGLCLEDVKMHTLELLTKEVAKELEIVDERIYA